MAPWLCPSLYEHIGQSWSQLGSQHAGDLHNNKLSLLSARPTAIVPVAQHHCLWASLRSYTVWWEAYVNNLPRVTIQKWVSRKFSYACLVQMWNLLCVVHKPAKCDEFTSSASITQYESVPSKQLHTGNTQLRGTLSKLQRNATYYSQTTMS